LAFAATGILNAIGVVVEVHISPQIRATSAYIPVHFSSKWQSGSLKAD